MKYDVSSGARFFFATAPLPCPYFPDRVERRVVTELIGNNATARHDALSLAGFRRSHDIAYVPACPDCTACVAVRVLASEFKPSRSFQRIQKKNRNVQIIECPPQVSDEQFALFTDYQHSRHRGGEMSKMDFLDYKSLVEETPVETVLFEFRETDDALVGACLVDRVDNGLSAVYSYYDPTLETRSFGTFMILWLIEKTRELGLDYTYLGYWIEGCQKMSYKIRFKPIEAFSPEGWQRLLELE